MLYPSGPLKVESPKIGGFRGKVILIPQLISTTSFVGDVKRYIKSLIVFHLIRNLHFEAQESII